MPEDIFDPSMHVVRKITLDVAHSDRLARREYIIRLGDVRSIALFLTIQNDGEQFDTSEFDVEFLAEIPSKPVKTVIIDECEPIDKTIGSYLYILPAEIASVVATISRIYLRLYKDGEIVHTTDEGTTIRVIDAIDITESEATSWISEFERAKQEIFDLLYGASDYLNSLAVPLGTGAGGTGAITITKAASNLAVESLASIETILTATDNLNSITTVGLYRWGSSSAPIGAPIAGGCNMIVDNQDRNSTTFSKRTRIRQTVFGNTDSHLHIVKRRSGDSGETWTNWASWNGESESLLYTVFTLANVDLNNVVNVGVRRFGQTNVPTITGLPDGFGSTAGVLRNDLTARNSTDAMGHVRQHLHQYAKVHEHFWERYSSNPQAPTPPFTPWFEWHYYRVKLYDNTSGTNGTLTISRPHSEFEKFNVLYGYTAASAIWVTVKATGFTLTHNRTYGGVLTIRNQNYTVSGSTITPGTDTSKIIVSASGMTYDTATNDILIFAVEGF